MAWPVSIQVALKEWSMVCDALSAGGQILLLRKGGISESACGFELEHREFLFFPTFLHQRASMLKPTAGPVETIADEPEQITLRLAGVVTDLVRLEARAQMNALDDLHIWSPALIDMRFDYRPKNPLYLLLVRTYRLPWPTTIRNTEHYKGCKSWVELSEPVAIGSAQPVLDDEKFNFIRDEINQRLRAARV